MGLPAGACEAQGAATPHPIPNSQFLLPHSPLRHPRLPRETVWEYWGDPALLEAPAFVPVILSRRLEGAALEAELCRIEAAVRAGAVAIGGFVSAAEKAAARRLAALPELRLIRLVPHPLALCRPAPGARHRILEGKTLLLSGIPDGDGRLRRDDCVRNNRWVLAIAEGSPTPTREAPPPIDPPAEGPDPAAVFL